MPGKGRALGYSDYYKGTSRSTEDEEREKSYSINISMGMPRGGSQPLKDDSEEADRKKAAIKRRLQRMRAGK